MVEFDLAVALLERGEEVSEAGLDAGGLGEDLVDVIDRIDGFLREEALAEFELVFVVAGVLVVLLAGGEGGEEVGAAAFGGFGVLRGDFIDRIDGGGLQGGDEAGFGAEIVHEAGGADAADGAEGGNVEVFEIAAGFGGLGGDEVEDFRGLHAVEQAVHDLREQAGGLGRGLHAGEGGGEALGVRTGAEELGQEGAHQGVLRSVLGAWFLVLGFPRGEGAGLEGGIELVEDAGEGGIGQDASVLGGAELLEHGGGVGGGISEAGENGEAVLLCGAGLLDLGEAVADLGDHAVEIGAEVRLDLLHEVLQQPGEVFEEVLHPADQAGGGIDRFRDGTGEGGVLHKHADELVHHVPFLGRGELWHAGLTGGGGVLVRGAVGGPDGLFQGVRQGLPFLAEGGVAVFLRVFAGELEDGGVDVLLDAGGAEGVLRALEVVELGDHGVQIDEAGDFPLDLEHGRHLAVEVTAGGASDGVGIVEGVVALEGLLERGEELASPGFLGRVLDAGEDAELVCGVGAVFAQRGRIGGEGGIGAVTGDLIDRSDRVDGAVGGAAGGGHGDGGLVLGAEVTVGGDLGAEGFPAKVLLHGCDEGFRRGGSDGLGDLAGGVTITDFAVFELLAEGGEVGRG